MTLTCKSAIQLLLSLALPLSISMSITTAEAAAPVGIVTNLSGFLLAKKSDGAMKILAPQSRVETGDTLLSEEASYARVRFDDDSEITLGPKTQLNIEAFAFETGKPENDRAKLVLSNGSMNVHTGIIGLRSPEKFSLVTPGGTVSGNGAFDVDYRLPTAESNATTQALFRHTSLAMDNSSMNDGPVYSALRDAVSALEQARTEAPWQLAQLVPTLPKPTAPTGVPGAPGLAPGLHVFVIDGLINVTNKGGTTNFAAGQFGYTPNPIKPPVVVPHNPGLLFTPPQAFVPTSGSGSGGGSKAAAIDCEVR